MPQVYYRKFLAVPTDGHRLCPCCVPYESQTCQGINRLCIANPARRNVFCVHRRLQAERLHGNYRMEPRAATLPGGDAIPTIVIFQIPLWPLRCSRIMGGSCVATGSFSDGERKPSLIGID